MPSKSLASFLFSAASMRLRIRSTARLVLDLKSPSLSRRVLSSLVSTLSGGGAGSSSSCADAVTGERQKIRRQKAKIKRQKEKHDRITGVAFQILPFACLLFAFTFF